MIVVTCDKCEKRLEVPDDLAGRKIECPACGDVNSVPGARVATDAGRPEAKKDRAVAAGYPPDDGPETRVMLVHPALVRGRPMTVFLHVLAMAAAGTGVVYFGMMKSNAVGLWSGVAVLAVALVSLAIQKLGCIDESLEITNKRSIARRGLLSKSTTEVLHDDIRNVQVTQTFAERIWRVGKIGLSSSGQEGLEIEMSDLPDPAGIKRVIDLYRPL